MKRRIVSVFIRFAFRVLEWLLTILTRSSSCGSSTRSSWHLPGHPAPPWRMSPPTCGSSASRGSLPASVGDAARSSWRWLLVEAAPLLAVLRAANRCNGLTTRHERWLLLLLLWWLLCRKWTLGRLTRRGGSRLSCDATARAWILPHNRLDLRLLSI